MVDNTLFTKKKSSNLIIVQIYVDDIIFGSICQDMCDEFAKTMHDEFEMSMMGELNFFLGLQIKQMEDGIFFNQSKYIKEMLNKFGLEDSKPMKTPMSSDTKLMKDEEYDNGTDREIWCIGYTLHDAMRRVDNAFPLHYAYQTVSRYRPPSTVSGRRDEGRVVRSESRKIATTHEIDRTHASEQPTSDSKNIPQDTTTYRSRQRDGRERRTAWPVNYYLGTKAIYCVETLQGAIDLSKNPVQHSRTKHIEIRHHFLRDNVQKGHISIEKVSSVDNIADILTKPLKRESFNYLRLGLGMMEHIP
ncbi:retrovirus-related pol polyprotein from transposon TNT 1-94 [Tanacetum coccineum]